MALFIAEDTDSTFVVRPGENTLQAAASALTAEGWADAAALSAATAEAASGPTYASTAAGDQKPAIQCAINVAQSGEVLIPIGRWRIDSGLTYAAPVNLYGEGMAAGPGDVLNTNCSQIIANFSSGDMLKVTSQYRSPPLMPPPRKARAALRLAS